MDKAVVASLVFWCFLVVAGMVRGNKGNKYNL
jgi:hypothetical protein